MAAARSRAHALDHRPADVIAAERAEQARKAASYDAAVAVLEAKLGPSWAIGCPTVAEALVEPHTLRVLLGEPHPKPVPSDAYIEELREAAGDREDMIQALVEAGYSVEQGEAIDGSELVNRCLDDLAAVRDHAARAKAEAATAIDDTTPEGVLALLDAAIDALEADGQPSNARAIQQTRDDIADWNGIPLRNEDAFIASKVEAVASAFDARRTDPIAAQSASLGRLDGAVLLARFRRLAAGTDEIIANPSDSGWSERQHLTMLAAICLALVAKLTADTTGGAF
jgi:hypothetical protein